ncbi:MAG TPA: ATP-binding cassette domain-containing protein, partial [Rubrivivax sp.]|nr:ATP-binding cassette domain-containing protein [Rubrivivax sp.]
PTTALDVTIQAQILDLLRSLQRERHMALLLITHDLGLVAGMAQRVALMYAGQIVEAAACDAFFAAPAHPYARALLQALPDAARRGQPLRAIAGTVPAPGQRVGGCRFAARCALRMPRCDTQAPPLLDLHDGRQVRCWLHASGGGASAGQGGQGGQGAQGAQGARGGYTTQPQPQRSEPIAAAARSSACDAAPAPPLLQLRALSVSYRAGSGLLRRGAAIPVVHEAGFDIARARTLALVGESGSGKTTIGKALVQLLRGQAIVSGQALLDGRNLFELQGPALRAARREVQIVFQDPFASLNPRLRVAELMAEGLLALRPQLDAPARSERIATLCTRVGLPLEALQRYPHEFSGGQRQRIAIARALAVQPKLLVLDEPTSALDVSVQAQILNLLRELQRELGLAYLFITHNLGVVEYLADEVAVLRAGRIVEHGACEQVLRRPQQPYTRELLAAVPRVPSQRRAA